MSNKMVYVVTGSEDGLLGVFGNVKAAYGVAKKYCGEDAPVKSYSLVLKTLRSLRSANVCDYGSRVTAYITSCYFNEEVY
jgi:hypothetical protein